MRELNFHADYDCSHFSVLLCVVRRSLGAPQSGDEMMYFEDPHQYEPELDGKQESLTELVSALLASDPIMTTNLLQEVHSKVQATVTSSKLASSCCSKPDLSRFLSFHQVTQYQQMLPQSEFQALLAEIPQHVQSSLLAEVPAWAR